MGAVKSVPPGGVPLAILLLAFALPAPPCLAQAPQEGDVSEVEDVSEQVGAEHSDAASTPMERIELLATDPRGASERMHDFVDLLYQYTVEEFPDVAAALGEKVKQDRWADSSIATIQRHKRETERGLEILETIDRENLTAGERLDYDLLHRWFESWVRGQAFPAELMPITQVGGLQQDVARTLSNMPRRTVAEAEDVLARLDAVPELVEQTLALLQRGLARGVTPPRVTLRDVPQQFQDLLSEDPLESPLLEAFRDLPETIPAADRERLVRAATASYSARVAPAIEKIHRFLTLTYLPNTRTSIAMKDLPRGEAWYAYLVESYTTTQVSPRQIHDVGLSEVERLRGEMETLVAELGFEGDLESFHEFLRTHSGFFYDDPEEMLRDYRDIAKRADAALPALFGYLPRMPYGVEAMPGLASQSQLAAYYDMGSFEAGRAGTFYVNTHELKSRPKWRMESLTLHEAVPGHHLQIAIAQEHEDLAWFRRIWGFTAFTEGWALYAEGLGYDMGLYKDPYQRFGQLTSEMWRALRLVVDTGLHAFGWDRQQAIDYMYANTGRTRHEVVVEVDRYIVWPGQALAYKMGELRIRHIRARAEHELGERFDLRVFHDALLADGALPLDLLERKMEGWMMATVRRDDS